MSKNALADIQATRPDAELAIDKVGVRGLVFPLRLRDRANGVQTVTARASLAVDLPARVRGAHMSRFVEALDAWQEDLGCQSMRRLLESLRSRLHSGRAWAKLDFAYLIRKSAPASGGSAGIAYECSVAAELKDSLIFTLGVKAPVMTVCPCSLAISAQGAHSQRAMISLRARISRFVWLEDFIELAEACGSSPVYPLLKREDEKYVTEAAFSQAAFVEDVARRAAAGLAAHPQVEGFEVEVESIESIHNHNAFAYIASGKDAPGNG